MKLLTYLSLVLLIGLFQTANCQEVGSLALLAKERYPMLEVCQPPGFNEEILCGTINVYENRASMEGRKIPIDVKIIPAFNPSTNSTAYLYHPGGPGGENDFMAYYFAPYGPAAKVRELHDVIIIDFRGTGSSAIPCKVYEEMYPYNYAMAYDVELVKACLEEVKDKVDLSQYNTENTVLDLEEIRKWLGLESYIIAGGSYGVRVALEYMRNFPDQVQALILKGCVPPDYNYVGNIDKHIQKGLERLFENCKNDPDCKDRYPLFEAQLYELRDRLTHKPQLISYPAKNKGSAEISLSIDDYTFTRMIGHLVMGGSKDQHIPMIVDQAYNGNFLPLIKADRDKLGMAAFFSAFCSEEINRFPELPEKEIASLFTKGNVAKEKLNGCEVWQPISSADWLNEELQGDVPILIMSGENDLQTPPRFGQQLADLFPNSKHVIIPNEGHFPSSSFLKCKYELVYQFLKDNKLSSIDLACIEQLKVSKPKPFLVYLNTDEFSKYKATFTKEDIELKVFERNGSHFLRDEYGEAEIYYLGKDTFGIQFCDPCRIVFEFEDKKVQRLRRMGRQTDIFEAEP